MYCPQCGQQFSVEMRFCKSCGFCLDGTRELLAPDTSLKVEKETHKMSLSRSRKGLYRGVIILIIGIILLSFSGVKSNFYPLLVLVFGVLRILYAMIFQEDKPRKKRPDYSLPNVGPVAANQLGTPPHNATLPLQPSVPDSVFDTAQVNTAEIVDPPSVTEHTTTLFKKSRALR